MLAAARIAYFSMEIGIQSAVPTYAGGLGVLAGDTIRSAADAGLPMVAVSLLARKGYFHQRLDETGWQTEEPVSWPVQDYLTELPPRVTVAIEGRKVQVRAWRYDVAGIHGQIVPVLFLDTDLEANAEPDRRLSYYLYGGDATYRLAQEAILGFGGVRMLRALGCANLARYHMNEGHASLLVLELLHELVQKEGVAMATRRHVDAIRPLCVFTTHTAVPAGHDQFPLDLVHRVVGLPEPLCELEQDFCHEGQLNLTYLALVHSHYINGVAKRHREVSQHLFARYAIDSITNGVHVGNWTAGPMQELFDRHIPGWREDNASLRYAVSLPNEEVWEAHRRNKRALVEYVNRETDAGFDFDVFTLGFARRATQYKRGDLIFSDIARLRQIAERAGPFQVVFAGKAHPHDQGGKELIQRICRAGHSLAGSGIRVAYLPEYDMGLARLLTAGADIWLNTPEPPLEASGTSGMKAAVNGVPSFSVLDGWWVEGCIEGVTGWAIGNNHAAPPEDRRADADSLYDKLERVIVPLFYRNRDQFIRVMRMTIALNGSFFNTERMIDQYVTKAYFR
ncbi:MAG: alpha-glucan family phosphorylase [Betaproteobacteria bacterium]|nr:alpha-glucan family phosphorylase [Betaproteobacteria bacterium]